MWKLKLWLHLKVWDIYYHLHPSKLNAIEIETRVNLAPGLAKLKK